MSGLTRTYWEIPIAYLATGARLALGVHEIAGSLPGPTLGVSAAVHGDEIIGTEVLRRLAARLDDVQLSGVLKILPLANPLAFEGLSRNTPLDMTNLNRVFPGDPAGWLSERVAYQMTERFLKTLDYYVDLHAGGAQPVVDYVYVLNAEQLSLAFGSRILYRSAGSYSGSTSEITTRLGIPTVVVELGGGPNCEEHIERGVAGVLNIMRSLGMLAAARGADPVRNTGSGMETDERLAAVERVIVRQMLTIRPSHGGLLVPEPPVPALGDVVEKGRVLGRVYHPATFELLETIASPLDRSLMILQRETVTRVHPGDYAYMLGDLLTAEHADLGGD